MYIKRTLLFIITLFLVKIAPAQLNAEQTAIQKVFFNFLYYYQKNEKKFNSFQLVKGTGKNFDPPFHIQWKEVERYTLFLKKNVPFVGEAYIASEKKDFLFYDSCYKNDPKEDLAVGFDFDRWGGGQESVSYLVNWQTNKKNIYKVKIVGNKAELIIGSSFYKGSTGAERNWSKVPFVKEKGKWVMAGNVESMDEYNPAQL